MNSIEENKKATVHEKQFDKRLQITKNMIEQINKGIEVKQYMGEKVFAITQTQKISILMN